MGGLPGPRASRYNPPQKLSVRSPEPDADPQHERSLASVAALPAYDEHSRHGPFPEIPGWAARGVFFCFSVQRS